MKKILFIALFGLLVSSCEVFTIKGKKIEKTETLSQNQNTAIGVVSLLLSEIGNDNTLAATELLAKSDGTFYSASEKYAKSTDLARIKRFIDNGEITSQTIDTVDNIYTISLEFNYTKKLKFDTKEINFKHYVTDFKIIN